MIRLMIQTGFFSGATYMAPASEWFKGGIDSPRAKELIRYGLHIGRRFYFQAK